MNYGGAKQLLRSLYRIAYPVREVYWKIFKPNVRAVRTVIFWQDKFLLSRISYGPQCWVFPGGGVRKKEAFKDAALREVYEEVGIRLADAELFYEYFFDGRHHVQCFFAEVTSGDFVIDGTEIAEARWFGKDELTTIKAPLVEKILLRYDEWVSKNKSL